MILCKSSQYVNNSNCEESTVTAYIIVRETALKGDNYEWNTYRFHSYIYYIYNLHIIAALADEMRALLMEHMFGNWVLIWKINCSVAAVWVSLLSLMESSFPKAVLLEPLALGREQKRGWRRIGLWFGWDTVSRSLDNGTFHRLAHQILRLVSSPEDTLCPKGGRQDHFRWSRCGLYLITTQLLSWVLLNIHLAHAWVISEGELLTMKQRKKEQTVKEM